jgi:hypothetical protein
MSRRDIALLDALAKKLGEKVGLEPLARADVIRAAIRRLAEAEGVALDAPKTKRR